MRLKYLFILLLLIVGTESLFAQGKTVEITVQQKAKDDFSDPKPLSLVRVYGFFDLRKAQNFRLKVKNDITYTPLAKDYDCDGMTNVEGICNLVLPNTGAVVVLPSFGEPILQNVRGRLKLTVNIVSEGKVMKEVITRANMKKTNRPRPSRRLGNRKILGPMPFYMFSEETRTDARMVLAPIVTVLETNDTFRIVRPFVKDGYDYQRTQERRMGFDNQNDPLVQFRSNDFMNTREDDSVSVMIELYPIERNKHYKVTATKWFENYRTAYVSDSVCLDEGYDKEPMRFLDYDLMRVELNRDRYKREGRREMMNDTRKLDLKFMVGKAAIDPNDSLSLLQLDQLKTDLARYVNDADAGITSVTIHGQASPDGGIAINQRLCSERAAFLREEIARTFPTLRSEMKATAEVAGWDQVAKLLEEDSLVDYSKQVMDIVVANKNTLVQERKIKALPFYDLIREKILPRLRVVDFTFGYYTNRVRTPEEVYELFQTDPDYRNGKKPQPYEFYHLFNMIKDPKDLEVLAKAALKSVKDEDFEKPWPLAAYILSECYLQRDTCDTTLLKPYLDWKRAGYTVPEIHKRNFEGSYEGWVNDEAIVTAQITHLCKAGDYFMADSVAVNLLPDVPRYNKMKRFLDCLNGLWNDPAVRDTVAASSLMNQIVVYAAQDDPDQDNTGFHEQALFMLEDTTQFDPKDPRVLYMIATLRFRLEAENKLAKVYPVTAFQKDEFFEPSPDDPTVDIYGYKRMDWGYPMVQCCLLDEKYLKYMLYDGEFNEQYRTAFMKNWKKLKGETQDDTK